MQPKAWWLVEFIFDFFKARNYKYMGTLALVIVKEGEVTTEGWCSYLIYPDWLLIPSKCIDLKRIDRSQRWSFHFFFALFCQTRLKLDWSVCNEVWNTFQIEFLIESLGSISILVSILPKIATRCRLSNITNQNWKFEFSVKNLVKMKGVLRYVA